MILFAVGGPKQFALRRNVQRYIAFDLYGADDKAPRRNKDSPALVLRAGVNRSLHGSGVERGSVALGAEIADIINARTEVVRGLRGLGRCISRGNPGGNGGHHPDPAAAGK